jgi:hypothetical protein
MQIGMLNLHQPGHFTVHAVLLCICLQFSAASCAEIPKLDFRQTLRDGVIVVGMECHKRNRTLELGIFYPGAPSTRPMDLWRTADLVKHDPATYTVTKILDVERRCTIGDDQYRIRFRGHADAMNAMWSCGAIVTADATVWKNGRKVFDGQLGDCNRDDGIRSVTFAAGADAPVVTRDVPAPLPGT